MIIVTTDGSERSRHAIPHAAAFARAVGSALRLLRVIDPEETESGALSWPKRLKAAIARMEDALSAVTVDEGVEAEPAVGVLYKGESTAQAILRCADEAGAEMIVMDSRGHGAVRHALLGSVAMGVLGGSDIPVMVTGPAIAAPPAVDGYRVLVTSDGSKASESVLTALAPFLSRLQVDLINVYLPRLGDAGEQAEMAAAYKQLANLQGRLPRSAHCHTIVRCALDLERPERIVIDTAREIGANALAMSTRGHGASRHVLLGSFAAACLGQSHVPIILARL